MLNSPMLSVHYGLAGIVLVFSAGAIFFKEARRVVLYLLALQILTGALTWWMTHFAPPPAHWILAVMTGGLYALGNVFERRGRSRVLVTFVAIIATVIIMYICSIGIHALRL
jgi:hypothetical protein